MTPGAEGFGENALSDDAFLGGRLRLFQPKQGYRAATDPVLLAAACAARPRDRVLDLGCGAGAVALCLGARVADLDLCGLEVQPAYADLARRNAARNRLALRVVEGDVLSPPAVLKGLTFDHVVTNPPFAAPGSGTAPPDPGRARAHGEGAARLEDFIALGLKRLAPKGRLTVIQRAEHLGRILSALEGVAGDIRVLPIAARAGRAAGRVIVSAAKGRASPLTLLPPLVMHDGAAHGRDGPDFSPSARAILEGGEGLPLQVHDNSMKLRR